MTPKGLSVTHKLEWRMFWVPPVPHRKLVRQLSLFVVQGKFGAELLDNARSDGTGKEYACITRELLFKHGSKAEPATASFCSLNELTMGKGRGLEAYPYS